MGQFKDITNKKYGKLLILHYLGVNKHRNSIWKCQCDCGTEVNVLGNCLRAGRVKSCGCYQKECTSKKFLKNIKGEKIGRLTVLHRVPNNKSKDVLWKCQCECGKRVIVKSGSLNNGRTKSCGCLHRDSVRKSPYLHLFNHLKQTASKNGKECSLSFSEFLNFTKLSTCHYCGRDVLWRKHGGGKTQAYNLDRKDNRIGYNKDNIVVCCPICNRMKGTLKYEYFYNFTRPIREGWQPV